jgi:predicted ATPase
VLNEPEASLHPHLFGALARLVARAAGRSQVVVVTHAARLITALTEQAGCLSIMLEKNFGETLIVGAKELGVPVWHWPVALGLTTPVCIETCANTS